MTQLISGHDAHIISHSYCHCYYTMKGREGFADCIQIGIKVSMQVFTRDIIL